MMISIGCCRFGAVPDDGSRAAVVGDERPRALKPGAGFFGML
jgi:hypothetical protein